MMSDVGIGNSPGRQRRSTERSRENIREYVKLLGKKVADSPSGQKSPRSGEGKSPVGSTSSKNRSDEELLEEESSPTQLSTYGKKDFLLKEKIMRKASVSPGKSPKAKRKLEIDSIPTFGLDFVCDDEIRNDKLDNSKIETQPLDIKDKTDAGEKSVTVDELRRGSSSDKDEETKHNSPTLKDGKNVVCFVSNSDVSEGFCGFDNKAQSHQKGREISRITTINTPLKRSTPKSEKAEPKSDSPPDLVLFLKEGRGRAQNWTEPPTLDPESIATRRRTRVPDDPKALALSKMKCIMNDKSKKDSKEVQKKDAKKDKKNKVMDTPESLKKLAQHYPIKDAGKSSSISKQEVQEDTIDIKNTKKVIAKSTVECESKARISDSSSSSDDGLESNIVKRQKGNKKTFYNLPSASKDDIQFLEPSKETQALQTNYLNLETILHQMSENKAESRIPVVIMSNSEKDGKDVKAMPKSKKKTDGIGQADKALLKMALSQKSYGGDSKGLKECSSVDGTTIPVKQDQKDLKLFKESLRINEQKTSGSGREVRQATVIANVPFKDKSSKGNIGSIDYNARQSNVSETNQRSEGNSTRCQDNRKVVGSNDTSVNHPLPKLLNSCSASSSSSVFPSSLLRPGAPSVHKPPLVVSVADFLSLRLATVNPRASGFSPRKLNLKIPNIKGMTADQILKNTIGIGKDSLIIKGGILNTASTAILNTGDERAKTPQVSASQQSALSAHKGPLLDYTDIETEEVVVGEETEDTSGQLLNVGELSAEVNLMADEQLDTSSEDESNKAPDPLPIVKKDMLSPEGRVALDHSYSSGSTEKTRGSNSARKKSPVTYEKSLTPRPVYSSGSLAKRSLDIMLHNDKINILRQMSQIFNHEKPVQPDTDNTVSSSDGEGEDGNQSKSGVTTQSKAVKDKKSAVSTENSDRSAVENLVEGSDDQVIETSPCPKTVSKQLTEHSTESVTSSNLLSSSGSVDASPSKIMDQSDAEAAEEERTPKKSDNSEKDFTSACLETDKVDETSTGGLTSDMCVTPKRAVKKTVTADSPFLGFPDHSAKVHHVPAYSVALDELIYVQSSVGPGGEVVDIVDGFAFISFNTEEEMSTYTHKQNTRGEKGHRPWLKKKRKKRRKLLIKQKKHQQTVACEAQDISASTSQLSKEVNSNNDTGAFASNDLDAYLNQNSHLNISYTIPKCRATEEGVTRLDEDGMPQDNKPLQIPAQVPESILMESPSNEAFESNSAQASSAENVPESVHQYEEVNAIDILYPKEKYKYYYNKDLCKETKADGSNVFVRRAGKLVPLTSVFKSHKASVGDSSNKKTVELVYVYDNGKLLTLGGSLTKINPSNSDSVRARVVLPVGIPPILKGEIVQAKAKKVQAVEINEDLAKFALSALQSPNPREEKVVEVTNKCESQVAVEADISAPQEQNEKIECAEKCEEKEQTVKVPENVSLVPTKRNILDIIAAKLAMSDDESDEKEEEKKQNVENKPENIAEQDKKANKCEEVNEKENSSEKAVIEQDKETEQDTDAKSAVTCVVTGEKLEMKKEEVAVASPTQKIPDPVKEPIEEKYKCEAEDKDMTADNSAKDENNAKDKASEVEEVIGDTSIEKTEADTKTLIKESNELLIKDEKDQIKDLVENVESEKESKEIKVQENTDEADTKNCTEFSGSKPLNTDSNGSVTSDLNSKTDKDSSSTQEEIKEENDERKQQNSVLEMTETDKAVDINAQKAEGKSRIFKRNMYRFPSLSREMKRLNMNFVKYVPQEPTTEDEMAMEIGPKEDCTNEHCRLGCVCDSLTCRRRIMDHCGRPECMFECSCRDESWKHSVSGTGRTMNAVSIFNLDREQNEGLAVREKDFRRTVIQTGSEVILVGAERKKRERRIPGRYRDSALWTGTDYATVNSPSTSEPEVPALPEYPSIPLAEASKYIKNFKLNVPWYNIKGISVWCMDHSCYDCRCLQDPTFTDSRKEVTPEKSEPLHLSSHISHTSSALDAFEAALRENGGSGSLSPHDSEVMDINPPIEACCTVVNVVVNNAEARRKYSWKLKDWYHPMEAHCARTSGYSKKRITEETKHLTLVGVAAKEITPEQMVETVVKSLREPKEKLPVPTGPGEANVSYMGDPFSNPQNVVGITSDQGELKGEKPKIAQVPLVDLTSSSNTDDVDSSPVPTRMPRQPKSKSTKAFLDSTKDVKVLDKRKLIALGDNSPNPSAKRSCQEDGVPRSTFLSLGSLSSSVESICPDENKAVLTTLDLTNSEREHEGVADTEKKKRWRRPLSLLEMMVAEERRGELELDLSSNFPGNALLVAEARFRKLINMNIIGVIGINKAGRCIIGTVDSIDSLRVMQRIHNMISNSTLDVGPNMREIFFPPPYVGTRPRFVMIRCDINCKWEIVGVVQKKGPNKSTRTPENKSRLGTMHKSTSVIPQVIDLEEEEKQKEQEKTEKPDIVILTAENEKPVAVGNVSSALNDSGAWEGSLPLIASVHSASDSNMAELIGSPERVSGDSLDKEPSYEGTSSGGKQPSKTKALPGLVPISASSVVEFDREIAQEKERLEAQNTSPAIEVITGSCEQPEHDIYVPPTAVTSTTKTTSTLCTPITSTLGMRTFTLNQSSGRVFGDSQAEVATSHALTSTVLSKGSSPQAAVLGSNSSGKLSLMSPKVISGSPNYILSIPEGNSSVIDDSGSHTAKSNDGPVQNRRVLSPVMPGGIPVSATSQTKVGESNNTAVNQNFAGPSTPNSKMLYIPVSSGCFSKMMFVPTVSGVPSPRMMILPTIPGAGGSGGGGGLDSGKLKMVLVPSTQESNKMILIPASAETTDVLSSSTTVTNVVSESDKKKMLVLPPTVISNLISKSSNLEQRSKFRFPRPTIINDPSTFQSSCTGTLLVPIKPAGSLPPKLDENLLQRKAEDNVVGTDVKKESTDQDNSDDVVVIGPATNSLTITRVRTATESTFPRAELNPKHSCTSPSLLILPAPPVCGSGIAETNVVSSVTTISSTMPGHIVSPQKDSGTVSVPSDVSAKASGSKTTSPSDDAVIVKTSLNAFQLNALLQSTHKELLKNGEDSSVAGSSKTLDSKDMISNEKEKSTESKHSQDSYESPSVNETPLVDHEQKGSEEVEEVGSKRVPIKKGGYHWSAVDLSLNFKSVKLEWLLGTIRKNVLMNIYRMSLKTRSPVTLSVKNGTSTSMLYGLARRGYVQNKEDLPLPILILGSVVSAVMSSSSTPDANLFQVNAIKYFIRENTGELSSYTYDTSGDFLVKLASKKRGDGGEMIGVGEKVPIQKVRETSYIGGDSRGSADDKGCLQSPGSKVQDCSCTVVGDFICMGHSAPQWKEKGYKVPMANDEFVSSKLQSLPSDQAGVILQEAAPSSISSGVLPQELPPPNTKASPEAILQLQGSSMPQCITKSTPLSSGSLLKGYLPSTSDMESTPLASTSETGSQQSSVISEDALCSQKDFLPESRELKANLSCEKDDQEEIEMGHTKSISKSDVKSGNDAESGPVSIDAATEEQQGKQIHVVGIQELELIEKTLDCPAEGNEETEDINVEDENEDIDIVGDCDMDLSMSSLLRKQLMDETAPGKKPKGNPNRTPGDVAKSLIVFQGSKRKIDAVYKHYERPCPRSKKRMLISGSGRTLSLTGQTVEPSELEACEGPGTKMSENPSFDLSSRWPTHLAHLRHTSGGMNITPSEEPVPGPSNIKAPLKPRFVVVPGKPKSGKSVARSQKKKNKLIDIEGNSEERNAVVHNELERMRRRVMRHLFNNLQGCVSYVPSSPLMGETVAQPKITILSSAQKVCEGLRKDEAKLCAEEEKIRRKRSSLIKKLVAVIADCNEEVRIKWRDWVRDNMQNPCARQDFEREWKPVDLEKYVFSISSNEYSFDLDLDDGSPLPTPSSPHVVAERSTPPLPTSKSGAHTSKDRAQFNTEKKMKKKVGRPQKLVLDKRYQGVNITSEAASSIPTSILLMAGTSSRGRKILRKEDANFVTS